jgi:anthranilate phosphoribosyltransferase
VNAAAALVAYEGIEDDVMASLRVGIDRAAAAIDSGAAAAALSRWISVAESLRPSAASR